MALVRAKPQKVNRPGAAKCCACKMMHSYTEMTKVRRRYWCDACKARLEHWGMWPPLIEEPDPDEPLFKIVDEEGWETVGG